MGVYQTSGKRFSRALIGYSKAGSYLLFTSKYFRGSGTSFSLICHKQSNLLGMAFTELEHTKAIIPLCIGDYWCVIVSISHFADRKISATIPLILDE